MVRSDPLKTKNKPYKMIMKPIPRFRRIHLFRNFAATAVAALLAMAAAARAQTDSFNGGGFPVGWATCQSSNYPGTYQLVSDGYGGSALRMACTASGFTNPPINLFEYDPRAVAWMTNQFYTNTFYIAVDLLSWNASPDRATNDAVFGIAERLVPYSTLLGGGYADPNVPVGQPDMVIFSTRFNQYGGTNSNPALNSTRGNFNMYYVGAGGKFVAAEAQNFSALDTGHSYRLVFTGTNDPSGKQFFVGYVYDLLDLTQPILTMYGSDGGLPGYMPGGIYSGTSGGYPGLIALGYNAQIQGADVTWDNFVASDLPPTSVSLPGTPHGLLGMPQVVNRTPASRANFYPASGGVSFNATTLTTTNTISSIRMYLNGVEVTSALVIGGQATNRTVTFSGLASNVVYDARIELTDAANRKTTNIWTFDTFSDAYLASAACRNIECEDIDFGGGLFIPNPPVSGFSSNDTIAQQFIQGYNTNESPAPGGNHVWTNAINSASGYVNRLGVKGTDFFDYDSVGTLAPYLNRRVPENQFSQVNPYGTTQGYYEYTYGYYDAGGTAKTFYWFDHDTQRQKYSSLVDPLVSSTNQLMEYVLERTEGGEWYNYTRSFFYGSNYFWGYLRHGCELTQPVRLDQIAAGPTTNFLGEFYLTNALIHSNFRYAALVNPSNNNNLAVVNLPTGTNTLRLTMDSPQYDGSKQGLALNYMAFVPALVVQSSATANTGYAIDNTAVVAPGTRQITIPQSGGTRFYRLMWDHQVTIKSVKLSGGNVLLAYE